MAAFFQKPLAHLPSHRLFVLVMAALLGAFLFSSGLADNQGSVDRSLLQMEAVKPRLDLTPELAASVARAANQNGVSGVSDLQPVLEQAASLSFNSAEMESRIASNLAKTGQVNVNASELAKAAHALSEARKASKNGGGETSLEPVDAERRSQISELLNTMASPELAVETAVTEQIMYAALEVVTNASAEQLAIAPIENLQAQTGATIQNLRARTTNENPTPKHAAKAQERERLALALEALTSDELAVLTRFYASEEGQAKRDTLISTYRDVSNAANAKLLNTYLERLITQSKNKSQQN
ncbi:hypothetical protein [Rhizobium helianthi]